MEWNIHKNMRSSNTQSSQVQVQQNTAPYFVTHLDSMSSHKLTLHSHYFVSSLEPMQRLCHPVPYGPMQRFCHPAHFFLFYLSYLTCYLSLCTSAKQLLCEPRNVLQSGPRFDFIQLSVSFISEPMQRLCHPVPYGPMQRLCHPAHFSLSLSFVVCQNFQFRFFPWYESSNLTHDFVHHVQIQNIQTQIANLKFQIPSLAFHSETHANAQTTVPLYFSLRILCKVPMLQISLNSMPAFW